MATAITIPQEIRSSLDGAIPFTVGTCDAEGTPNVTFMSQLFYVNEHQVAISYQFMNKTWRNLLVNPVFTAFVTNPDDLTLWRLSLEFTEEKQDGSVFEEMEMQLLALATPEHIQFSLHSALICNLIACDLIFDGRNPA